MNKKAILILVFLTLASLLGACSAESRSFHRGISPDLVGTDWTLTSLNGSSLIEDTEITLLFKKAHLGGAMTCNHYGGGPDSGRFTATGDGRLAIPQLAVTVQLCPEPEGIMEQEAAYIEALHDASTYRVSGDRLEIADAGGRTRLVFQQATEVARGYPTVIEGTQPLTDKAADETVLQAERAEVRRQHTVRSRARRQTGRQGISFTPCWDRFEPRPDRASAPAPTKHRCFVSTRAERRSGPSRRTPSRSTAPRTCTRCSTAPAFPWVPWTTQTQRRWAWYAWH